MMYEWDAMYQALRECDDPEAIEREKIYRALIDIGSDHVRSNKPIVKHKWTQEMDEFLIENIETPTRILITKLNAEFNTNITQAAMMTRIYNMKKMGLMDVQGASGASLGETN